MVKAERHEELLAVLQRAPLEWSSQRHAVDAYKAAADVLADLVRTSPGEAGKWVAAAKDAGLFGEALALARRSPCDPLTLARAARDHCTTHVEFAMNAGLLALHGMVVGQAYELEASEVRMAYDGTIAAAEQLGLSREAEASVRRVIAAGGPLASYVASALPKERSA